MTRYKYKEYKKYFELAINYESNDKESCKKYLLKAKKSLIDSLFDADNHLAAIISYKINEIDYLLVNMHDVKIINNYYLNSKFNELKNFIKNNYDADIETFNNKDKYIIIFNLFPEEYDETCITVSINYVNNKYIDLAITFSDFQINENIKKSLNEFIEYRNDKSYNIGLYYDSFNDLTTLYKRSYNTTNLIEELNNFINLLNSSELISFFKCLKS